METLEDRGAGMARLSEVHDTIADNGASAPQTKKLDTEDLLQLENLHLRSQNLALQRDAIVNAIRSKHNLEGDWCLDLQIGVAVLKTEEGE